MATKRIPPTLSAFNDLPDAALIDVFFVALLFDCSTTTVWRRAKTGLLPAPLRISDQQTRWRVGDIRQALAGLGNAGKRAA
jgi:predicted DNA-binding transcriptional regulator AlpA